MTCEHPIPRIFYTTLSFLLSLPSAMGFFLYYHRIPAHIDLHWPGFIYGIVWYLIGYNVLVLINSRRECNKTGELFIYFFQICGLMFIPEPELIFVSFNFLFSFSFFFKTS